MDYKNKYEQALERARIWKDKSGMPKDKQGILDDIFPELAESEDEKIRKALINGFNKLDKSAVWYNGITNAQILDWLEKQDKETSWKPSKEEMDALYGLAYITNKMDDKKDEAITKLYQDLKREFFNGASYENMFPSSGINLDNR